MATIDIYDISKNKVGVLELSEAVFNCEIKKHLIHDAVKTIARESSCRNRCRKKSLGSCGKWQRSRSVRRGQDRHVRVAAELLSILAVVLLLAHRLKHIIFP